MNLLLNAFNVHIIEAETTEFNILCNIAKSLVEIKSLPLDQICVGPSAIKYHMALSL